MRCPFLREAQVRSCQASPFRKPIVRSELAEPGLCGSPAHRGCASAPEIHEERPSGDRCPFLAESLVQFCAAAPVTKYIPYSDSAGATCGSERHRFCELYLALAGSSAPAVRAPADERGTEDALGVPLPRWLWYADGHTWLDLAEDGTCHVGVDALLARMVGPVEEVELLTLKGVERPMAVLRAAGVDVPVTFPNRLLLEGANTSLRAAPARLASDPYGLGWLFVGQARERASGHTLPSRVTEGLHHGAEAVSWMRGEAARLHDLVADAASRSAGVSGAAADGGLPEAGVLRLLPREEALRLVHTFVVPRRSS